MRTILICIIGICTMFTAYAQEIKENGTHKEFVYPGTQIYYISEAPSNVVINEITWKVTNGSFNEYNDITSTHDKYRVLFIGKIQKFQEVLFRKGLFLQKSVTQIMEKRKLLPNHYLKISLVIMV